MIAKQTVFLTEDRKRAVAQNDPAAKFKLIHVGQEISEAQDESARASEVGAESHRDPRARHHRPRSEA